MYNNHINLWEIQNVIEQKFYSETFEIAKKIKYKN